MTVAYLLAAVAGLVYIALTWLITDVLHLKGTQAMVVRIVLVAIGVAAVAAVLWFRARKKKEKPADSGSGAGAAAAAPGDELEALLREAESRLSSSQLAQGARYSNLPVFLVVGETGSTKTSTIVHSGIDAELLAGQVYQDRDIVPTRLANVWFARQAVFVEAAQSLLSGDAWSRLVRRLAPGKLQTVRKGEQAPRAAVVCFDGETFVRQGASEAVVVSARNLHARLKEVSSLLGINLPVYVLFTRMDRVAFFHDYVQNLSDDEAMQAVGVTLPIDKGGAAGVYAQQQTDRLTAAFNSLFHGLCDKRPDFLSRENEAGRLPGIYEFPREFRKVRTTLVQFLVDLCRPSQLTTGPFLRGFYFSGVRPVIIKEVVAAPSHRAPAQPSGSAAGATGMFKMGQAAQQAAGFGGEVTSTRKVPQWTFVRSFFMDVLLADRAALGASGSSTKTSALRRGLLIAGAALCLLLGIAFTISFFNNRSLEGAALNAANGIASTEAAGANLPSADALTRLESLRQSLETLSRYEREGAPWSLRWGLYTGSAMYPNVRKIYFDKFKQLLFGSTQQGLLSTLKGLPATPGPNDDYGYAYDTLKGYLITTSHHDKSTQPFLGPLLRNRWSANRDVDPIRAQLAQKQFDFYAEELKYENPYDSGNDTASIERARKYLTQFAGPERVYQNMLAEANRNNKPVNFNQRFPGSAEVVLNNRDVMGAYTKGGWAFMQDAIKHADRYFSGEQWVLGDVAGASVDRSKLEGQLRARYFNDFIGQWREYLKRSQVVRYKDVPDAAKKLNLTSNAQSPLLAMFWLASQNTGVDAPEVVKAFKPLHTVMPPASVDQYIGPTNADYMKTLASLQISLEQVSATPPGGSSDAAAQQTLANATGARLLTRQMAQGFGLDPEAHLEATVQKLLEDPITNTESLLRGMGPAELNAKGAALCAQFRPVFAKYPFNPAATAQATLPEVSSLFKPKDGALWQMYESSLQKLLVKQGAEYAPAPNAAIPLAPSFVAFFNRAAAYSNALYAGSPDPHLDYQLKPVNTEGIQSQSLSIDGQTVTFTGGTAAAQKFTWPGTGAGVKATVKFGNGPDLAWASHQGLWAAYQFFWRADKWQTAGSVSTLEWIIRIGKDAVTLPNGNPLTVRYELDMGPAPPVFQKGYLSSLACVSQVAVAK